MYDDRDDAGLVERRRRGFLLFAGVIVVCLLLMGAADRLLDLGPVLGNILFVGLPIFAALVVTASLQDRD